MKRTLWMVLSAIFALALLQGTGADEKTPPPPPPNLDGAWSGTWTIYQPGDEDKPKTSRMPSFPLECNVTRKGRKWQAIFEGKAGAAYKYVIKMEGRQAGTAVLFKGTVDLGKKDGGVFDWIGRATDKEFTGFYASENYTGVFRLARKP